MSYADEQYHTLLQELVDLAENTSAVENRTDINTFSLFGRQMRFNLAEGFPLLTTKKVHFKSVVSELLWFLRGDTNIKYLLERDNHIWTDWRYKAYLQDHGKRSTPNSPEPLSMAEFENLLLNDPTIAEAYGDIGKGYGHQWRNFGNVQEFCEVTASLNSGDGWYDVQEGFDQISWVINEIQTNPKSRRLIVSGWNPHEVDKVDLPPCHTLFQFHVELMTLDERIAYTGSPSAGVMRMKATAGSGGIPHDTDKALDYFKVPTHKLSCQLYQRSADVFLGVPFNIASYALLTQMIAQVCGLGLGEFIWTGGNVHLYENHLTQAKDQLIRNPAWHDCPKLTIDTEGKTIFEITEEDVHLEDYNHFPPIKAPVAV